MTLTTVGELIPMVQWRTREMRDGSERLVEQVSSSAHSQCKSARASHHSLENQQLSEAGVEDLFAAAFSVCCFASSIAALAIGFMLSNCFAVAPGDICTQNTRVDRIRVKKLYNFGVAKKHTR